MDRPKRVERRRLLIIPLVLAVSTATGLVALASTTSGCDDDGEPAPVDGSVGDGQPDTPII